jgi:mannose-6-phosphate isomerase-like protein (cupin superfamily)
LSVTTLFGPRYPEPTRATGDAARFGPTYCDELAAAAELKPSKSNWAGPISKPPFPAYPLIGALAYTFGGIVPNERHGAERRFGSPLSSLEKLPDGRLSTFCRPDHMRAGLRQIRTQRTTTMVSEDNGAFIRNIAEVPWREFPDHFGGALSKPLVMPETANSRHIDYRISMYQPMAHVARHKHQVQEQIYHVLEGEGLMEIAGKKHVVRKHDFIFLPPGVEHAISNSGLVDLVFLVITSPVADGENRLEGG